MNAHAQNSPAASPESQPPVPAEVARLFLDAELGEMVAELDLDQWIYLANKMERWTKTLRFAINTVSPVWFNTALN